MKQTGISARVAMLGVLTALAFILGYLESLIPSFTGIPGVKAGFANIVTMTALFLPVSSVRNDRLPCISNLLCAFGISLIRILLGGITYNGMSAALYGLAGAVFSLLIMFLLARTGIFSITAVSAAGGVAHNAAQLALAVLILGDAVFYYLPVLIITGLIAGVCIGLLASLLIRRLRTRI